MNTDIFFQKIKSYTDLSQETERAGSDILKEKVYGKGDYFLQTGQVPRKAGFVYKGLLSQYYITDKGDTVIKYFFPEGRIAGPIPATLTRRTSPFTIEAIEQATVLEYDFHEFKRLVASYRDAADFISAIWNRTGLLIKNHLQRTTGSRLDVSTWFCRPRRASMGIGVYGYIQISAAIKPSAVTFKKVIMKKKSSALLVYLVALANKSISQKILL